MPFSMSRSAYAVVLSVAVCASAQVAPVSYHLETIAGGDFAGDGGAASQALLVQVEGVAVDARGNIYLADAGDHRVRMISPSGIISTVAGNGRPGFSGDGGPAESAQLRNPYGLAIDRSGNLYIADLGNARIRRVSPVGVISTIAGGGTLLPADGQSPTAVELLMPRNVAVDSYGILYFSDFGGNRVYQVSESGTLAILAGSGQPGFAGDSGPAVLGQLNAPAGIVVDPAGALFIADSGNSRIRKVWRGVMTTWSDGIALRTPAGLSLDPDGSLFVADIGGNQIVRITPLLAPTPIAQSARDLAIDAQGNLYACSGPLVYRRPRFGESSLIAGSLAASYIGDGSTAARARFQQPTAIARDTVGNLYVADTVNHRIRKITTDGSVATIAGNGLRGHGGDGDLAIGAQLDSPTGVAVDASGNVYIGDTGNHRIRKVDAAGIITTIAGTGVRRGSPDGTPAAKADLDTPAWIVAAKDGSLYFTETGRNAVRRIDGFGVLGTVAGNGSRGFTGDGGPAVSASLDAPRGLAIDAAGNVYVADSGNHRIRKVAAPNTYGPPLISTYPDSNAAIWRGIRGIAVGNDGRVFVADAEDARLFRVDGPGQILAVAGTGVPSFNTESGPSLQQGLNGPAGLVVDASGSVYFTDSANNRVRKITPISDIVPPPPTSNPTIAIANAASLQAGPVAPGEIVSLFGTGLGPAAGVSAVLPAFELGGTQVLFNNQRAGLFYASQAQVNLQVPASIAAGTTADLQVVNGGVVRAKGSMQIAEAAPAIFTASGGGTGQAAALNEDGSYNSESNPAARGSIVVLFATGEGRSALPVSLRIGGYAAELLYAGPAPGFAGLMQINARVPGGFLPPGQQPVTVQVGGATSQPGVTVSLR